MSEWVNLYVGSGKEIARDGQAPFFKVEIDLDELKSHMRPDHIRTWTDKRNNQHRVLTLVLSPLKPENRTDYRTHSLKIDTWKPVGGGNVLVSKSSPNAGDSGDFFGAKKYDAKPRNDVVDLEDVPF